MMSPKIILLTSVFFHFLLADIRAQVGIGAAQPDPSAQLEVQVTNRGLLKPRMNTSGNFNPYITAAACLFGFSKMKQME